MIFSVSDHGQLLMCIVIIDVSKGKKHTQQKTFFSELFLVVLSPGGRQ